MELSSELRAKAAADELVRTLGIERVFLVKVTGFNTGVIFSWHPDPSIALGSFLFRDSEFSEELYRVLKERGAIELDRYDDILIIGHEKKWAVLPDDLLSVLGEDPARP